MDSPSSTSCEKPILWDQFSSPAVPAKLSGHNFKGSATPPLTGLLNRGTVDIIGSTLSLGGPLLCFPHLNGAVQFFRLNSSSPFLGFQLACCCRFRSSAISLMKFFLGRADTLSNKLHGGFRLGATPYVHSEIHTRLRLRDLNCFALAMDNPAHSRYGPSQKL